MANKNIPSGPFCSVCRGQLTTLYARLKVLGRKQHPGRTMLPLPAYKYCVTCNKVFKNELWVAYSMPPVPSVPLTTPKKDEVEDI